MTKALHSSSDRTVINTEDDSNGYFFAVYDHCITNNVPSGDLAFIEQRAYPYTGSELVSINEKYFTSLSRAKTYVNAHFLSGAEYFSLAQSEHPENILYILVDKITYLMA